MSLKRILKKQLKAINTPPMERVLPESADRNTSHTASSRRPIGISVTAVVLACLLMISAVAAIPEIVKRLNAPEIMENNYKLTEVPDGWVGIYTLDDLEKLRRKEYQNTNFILMNDIVIPDSAYGADGCYANGFQPLGIYANETDPPSVYTGNFNGNGYTVSNLKLVPSVGYGKTTVVGLLGYASKILFLGVENVQIILNGTWETEDVYVGALAAKADYVAGCYGENITVRYHCTGSVEETAVGTLCGRAVYIDSCYVKNGDIQILDESTGKTMLVGGIAGMSYSCITSYFIGNVTASGANYQNCTVNAVTAMLYPAYTPVLLSDESMKIMRQKLKENTDTFYYNKFLQYYVEVDRNQIEASKTEDKKQALIAYFEHLDSVSDAFYTQDKSEERIWWIFDGYADIDEILLTTQILVEAFGGIEAFETFCMEQNIKCGQLYCQAFDANTVVTAKDLPCFDFENLWIETELGIVLRIFTES